MSGVMLFGPSGFIGQHVHRALLADARVPAVSCVDLGRYDLARDDLAGLVGLLREVRPDAVVTCAGRLSGSAHEHVAVHTLATAKLVDAIAAVVPGARLVRIGSAAEYGWVPPGRPVPENRPAVPVTEYGLSHLAATRLVELASSDGRVDGVVLRVFNPIGPCQSGDSLLGRAATLMREALSTGEQRVHLAPLGAYRDFIDVRDVAAAALAAVTVPPQPEARVFNVASGTAVTARDAVEMLADAIGFTGEIHEAATGDPDPAGAPVLPPSRSAGVPWMQGDIGRARSVLGWAPVHDLAGSIKAIVTGEA